MTVTIKVETWAKNISSGMKLKPLPLMNKTITTVIALASCNSLSLLDKLFGEILVPETVYTETTIADKPESLKLRGYL